MKQDVLIPKMKRREKGKFKIPFLSLALIVLGVLLIIFSSFVGFELKHYILPMGLFNGQKLYPEDFVKIYFYIPQIPMVMFVCSALGKKIGAFSVLIYIILGLSVFPIFALGGGIGYLWEYGFGYILAYVPVVAIGGSILEKRYSFVNMFFVSVFGVLTIHFLGVLYMTVIAILKQDGFNFIMGWIKYQSGIKILYDITVSFVLVIFGKYIQEGLRFIKN